MLARGGGVVRHDDGGPFDWEGKGMREADGRVRARDN